MHKSKKHAKRAMLKWQAPFSEKGHASPESSLICAGPATSRSLFRVKENSCSPHP